MEDHLKLTALTLRHTHIDTLRDNHETQSKDNFAEELQVVKRKKMNIFYICRAIETITTIK